MKTHRPEGRYEGASSESRPAADVPAAYGDAGRVDARAARVARAGEPGGTCPEDRGRLGPGAGRGGRLLPAPHHAQRQAAGAARRPGRRDAGVGAPWQCSSSRLATSPSGPPYPRREGTPGACLHGPLRGVRLRRAGGRRVRGCGPHSGSGPAARGIPGPARVSFLRDKAEHSGTSVLHSRHRLLSSAPAAGKRPRVTTLSSDANVGRAEGARHVFRTTRREGSIWRESPASRALALSASRSGSSPSSQPHQVVRVDEQRRDPLALARRGAPRARRGTLATHWRESPASPANGAFVLSASRGGRGSSGQPQQVVRADEQGRDPLGAGGKGAPRARGGTSATHPGEGR